MTAEDFSCPPLAFQTVQSQYPTQKTRMRTSFDPELELPKLQRWFAENQHPSRQQVSTEPSASWHSKRPSLAPEDGGRFSLRNAVLPFLVQKVGQCNTKTVYFFLFLIFCWPCISIYLFINTNQLDALNFIISLFQASTRFEHMCSSSGGQNCIIQFLVSSHL